MIIIDRWWSDFFIAPKNSGLFERHPAFLSKFLSLPRPDLFVILGVPTEVSMRRRPDENMDIIAYKKEHILKFTAQHFLEPILRLDGEDAIDDNLRKIHSQLYKSWCNILGVKSVHSLRGLLS